MDRLADYQEWIRALHIISAIAWMAGMLYLPRLYVYHCELEPGSPASEMFKTMERRLLRRIVDPAMVATFLFGLLLLLAPGVVDWSAGWIWVKLRDDPGAGVAARALCALAPRLRRGPRPPPAAGLPHRQRGARAPHGGHRRHGGGQALLTVGGGGDDGGAATPRTPFPRSRRPGVIPAKAGIQTGSSTRLVALDPRLRGGDLLGRPPPQQVTLTFAARCTMLVAVSGKARPDAPDRIPR